MDLLLIFVSGVVGSSHCVGMCGGFVLTIGSVAPNLSSNLLRQTVYSSGRIATYAFLGAIAGVAGLRLTVIAGPTLHVQAVLAVAAGLFLILQGLIAARVLPSWKQITGRAGGCTSGCFSALLMGRDYCHCFVAGVFTGFLPCGLVYAFLTLAVGSAGLFRGMAIMTAFGLGTVPVLMLTGCSGSLLSLRLRRHAFTLAAWCIVVTGAVSIARGASAYLANTPACPLCG